MYQQLVPFSFSTSSQSLELKINATRIVPTVENSALLPELLIDFCFLGPLEMLLIPKAHKHPTRKDELWKHTCLEAFFCEDSSPSTPYFEVNCSTSGDWNAYYFNSYRQGMSPALNLNVQLTQHQCSHDKALFRISIRGDIIARIHHLGVTAVVEFTEGSKSYYALKHAGSQPDFHLKESFNISL